MYADDDDPPSHHAQLDWPEGGGVMFGSHKPEGWSLPPGGAGFYVVTADPRAVHDRAVQAGAEITRELNEPGYGGWEFGLRDPEGNQWSFGSYRGEARGRLSLRLPRAAPWRPGPRAALCGGRTLSRTAGGLLGPRRRVTRAYARTGGVALAAPRCGGTDEPTAAARGHRRPPRAAARDAEPLPVAHRSRRGGGTAARHATGSPCPR